jgi:transcriptional regulator with XRE-family HTH domain
LKQKLSRLDLEVNIDINSTEISKIENGLRNSEFFTSVKLAEALDAEAIELFKNQEVNLLPAQLSSAHGYFCILAQEMG